MSEGKGGGSAGNTSVTVGAIQCPLGGAREENVARVENGSCAKRRKRAGRSSLPPELFEGPYFCRHERESFFDEARPFEGNETIRRFADLARELHVRDPRSPSSSAPGKPTTTASLSSTPTAR